jgi:hypothetical protein
VGWMHDSTRVMADEASGGLASPPMGYEVTTPVYEGPFDLLLHLILREQVDIHEVPWRRSSTCTWPSSTA